MAWIAVLNDNEEELVRFSIEPEGWQKAWGMGLERALPGLINAVDEAVLQDEHERMRNAARRTT